MIELLISLLVILLVFGAIWYCLTLLPLPHPFGVIAQVILIVILVLVLLAYLLPVLRLPPIAR